jgi:hypothetical protein
MSDEDVRTMDSQDGRIEFEHTAARHLSEDIRPRITIKSNSFWLVCREHLSVDFKLILLREKLSAYIRRKILKSKGWSDAFATQRQI